MPDTLNPWDCRWPDPVALHVAADRRLYQRDPADATLNRTLAIRVHVEPAARADAPIRAILVTPWGVERVHWSDPSRPTPPIHTTAPLATDAAGRIQSGIALLLACEGKQLPVLTAWEPEVGHHFIETLLHTVQPFATAEEAMAAATGKDRETPPTRSIADHLNRRVDRRALLGIFRR